MTALHMKLLPLNPSMEKVDALSDRITYVGNWEEYHNSEFYMGNAMRTDEAGAYAELTFRGTAVRLYAEMSFNFWHCRCLFRRRVSGKHNPIRPGSNWAANV